jgi:trigger factor
MNITKQDAEGLSAIINLVIDKPDYEEKVNNQIAEYRKKARIDGFRPGKVPAGLIQKMYGKTILVDEISKLINDSLNKYLTDNNIETIGDPIPANEEKAINWDTDTTFEFAFEIGLAPVFSADLSDKITLPLYQIKVDDAMVDSYVDNYARRFGKFVDAQAVSEGAMVRGNLSELSADGNMVEGGISATDSSVYIDIMKDEDEKKKFAGAKVDDIITIDLKKALPNPTELKNILRANESAIENCSGLFQMQITSVSSFEKAEVNQDLFDKVFGEGEVKSEEEFRTKIIEATRESLERDSEYRLMIDARDVLVNKYDIQLPNAFLKKWLLRQNEGKITEEQFEKEFPLFEKDMKWQLIKNKISKQYNIQVNDEDMIAKAKESARNQFAQYGINNVPDEHLSNYAIEMLKREKDARAILDQVVDSKIIATLKEKVKLDTKLVSTEEFEKLFAAN